jgi:hypothetical protein
MQQTDPLPQALVVGVFDDRYAAEQAVDDLEQAGFHHDQVGYAIRGADAVAGGMITDAVGTKDARGAVTGLIGGGAIGAILGAAAALIVPGVGPMISAGILTTALGGAAAGAATGGILGALGGLGVSEEEALYYEKELRTGKAIVTVLAGAQRELATEVLRRHGARQIASHVIAVPHGPADNPQSTSQMR